MKHPFKGCIVAVTGDFGERRGIEKMRQWIQVNGGEFVQHIDVDVTHLICSKEHFLRDVTLVKQARALGSVHIVSFDWLEDSLMKMTRLSARSYLMKPRSKTAKEIKEKKKVTRKENIQNGMAKFEQACQEFMQDMKRGGYEPYRDPCDDFTYDVTLARANLLTNKNERYQLKLYVSHATPKMYACYVKYSAPNSKSVFELLAPTNSSWDLAWSAFQRFFRLKTQKDWSMRFLHWEEGKGPKQAFVYSPPKEGEPKGMFLEL